MKLQSKRIVLTGASSGIGRALLDILLREGAWVVVGDLQPIDMAPHPHLHSLVVDISKKTEIDHLISFAMDKFQTIDVFIANAGFSYYEKIQEENWQRMEKIFETNVFSPIYTVQKLNRLFPQGYHFVVTASAMAFYPLTGYALYSATKSAVHAFMEAFRAEVGTKSHLTVVYPIATKTHFFERAGVSIPKPWPMQSPETVAQKIFQSILRKKTHVHPSLLFRIVHHLNRFLPFLLHFYQWRMRHLWHQWHRTKGQ